MKKKVRMLDSVAGLGDPRPVEDLDQKYQAIRDRNKAAERPLTERTIENQIATMKLRDRYAEKPLGFKRDWSFKVDQEAMIPADLAAKWEDAGLCVILTEEKKAA